MASGDTLNTFSAIGGWFQPTSNMATPDTRNLVPVVDFDDTTGETLYFIGVLPQSYAGGGITVYVTWMATSAVVGTIGWLIAFARLNDQDVDSYAFAGDQTITAATVPGTAGDPETTNVAVTDGANIDGLTVGDTFVLRVTRDVAGDSAVGDAELLSVELKET